MTAPPLKWAGGKRNLLNKLEPLLSGKATEDNKFIDAFAGAGSVSIAMLNHFKTVIYNDTNPEIINVMNTIKNQPHALIEHLKEAEDLNSKSYFMDVRAWDRQKNFKLINNVKRAMRTIYLNKTCYNGLYRVNLKGQFNVPYGKYKNPNIVNEANILALSTLFNEKSIHFFDKDYSIVIDKAQAGDVVYFDPPYHQNSPNYFTAYNEKIFDEKDHERLKHDFDKLTEKNVYAVISNSSTDFILELYKKYINKKSIIKVQKSVGAKANSRKKVDEVLITNFKHVKG